MDRPTVAHNYRLPAKMVATRLMTNAVIKWHITLLVAPGSQIVKDRVSSWIYHSSFVGKYCHIVEFSAITYIKFYFVLRFSFLGMFCYSGCDIVIVRHTRFRTLQHIVFEFNVKSPSFLKHPDHGLSFLLRNTRNRPSVQSVTWKSGHLWLLCTVHTDFFYSEYKSKVL